MVRFSHQYRTCYLSECFYQSYKLNQKNNFTNNKSPPNTPTWKNIGSSLQQTNFLAGKGENLPWDSFHHKPVFVAGHTIMWHTNKYFSTIFFLDIDCHQRNDVNKLVHKTRKNLLASSASSNEYAVNRVYQRLVLDS